MSNLNRRPSHVPWQVLAKMEEFSKLDLIEICFDLCMAGVDMDETSFTYEKAIKEISKRKTIIKNQLRPKE